MLVPAYVPTVEDLSGLVLDVVDGSWSRVGGGEELRWSWWFGHGHRVQGWYVPLVVPLFLACLPDPSVPSASDPPPVALARLSGRGEEVRVEPVWVRHRPWLEGIRVLGDLDTKLTREEADAVRVDYVEHWVLPVVRRKFEEFRRCGRRC